MITLDTYGGSATVFDLGERLPPSRVQFLSGRALRGVLVAVAAFSTMRQKTDDPPPCDGQTECLCTYRNNWRPLVRGESHGNPIHSSGNKVTVLGKR